MEHDEHSRKQEILPAVPQADNTALRTREADGLVAHPSDGRLRYAEGIADGGTATPPALPAAPPRFRRVKRLLRNVGLFMLLCLAGSLILALFGEKGLAGSKHFVETWWWPASLMRFLCYAAFTFFLLPKMLASLRAQALAGLEVRRAQALSQEAVDYGRLQKIARAELRLRAALPRTAHLFFVLLLLDLMLFQLPFLMS